jgi:hypothetical protein
MDLKSQHGTPSTLLGQSDSFLSKETRSRACYCIFEGSLTPVSQLNTRAEETHMTGSGHYAVLEVRLISPRALLCASSSCHETPAVRLDFEPVDAC